LPTESLLNRYGIFERYYKGFGTCCEIFGTCSEVFGTCTENFGACPENFKTYYKILSDSLVFSGGINNNYLQ
jgi:hypothetical protein